MAKRHFLQQSHKFVAKKHPLAGRFMSEKLDGQRAYWDGGISRGMIKREVPWANNVGDYRYTGPIYSTGLWSRYGNVIHAPAWFLDFLPPFPLDGELWVDRGKHQECRKAISPLIPDDLKWEKVKFIVFDSPAYESLFYPSVIDIPNFHKEITSDCLRWIGSRGAKNLVTLETPYAATYDMLGAMGQWNKQIILLPQVLLSTNRSEAREQYEAMLSEVLRLGGEGLVTRDPLSPYVAERVHHCLKHKPFNDSEATVIGYVTGKETDKGSKLLGLMGSMIVGWNGHIFQLSGFTDSERILTSINKEMNHETPFDARKDAYEWACNNPGEITPHGIIAVNFPRGSKVTFKYRELTDDGIPKEAVYLRKREVE